MAYYVLSDNYDEGLEMSEFETFEDLVTGLVKMTEFEGSLKRVDTIIEGREVEIPFSAVAGESQRRHDVRKRVH